MKAYGFRHGVAAALLGVFLLAGCEDAFKSQEPENLENFSPEEIFKKAELENLTTHAAALEIAEQRINDRKNA